MLIELKLSDPRLEPAYHITLISPRFINIGALTRPDGHLHIRVKELGIVPDEYENHCNAWRAFPQYVAEPLGRCVDGEWEIFVVRGIPHRSVPAGAVASGTSSLVSELVAFMNASSKSARVATPRESHTAMLRRIHERTNDLICAEIVAEWIAAEPLDELPHIQQHGDFVVNNLGLTDSGLCVFDWEDYGRIALPGFDLCTLLASDAKFDPDAMRNLIPRTGHGTNVYADLLDQACPKIGLTPETFLKLIPLYLVMFLDLKRDHQNYGNAIRHLLLTAIHAARTGAQI
jgi:hypothetical protein